MFSAPSLIQPHRSIPERLTPTYQYHILTDWVLKYQKEIAELVDKVCRDGLNSVQSRYNNSLAVKKMQTTPYFAVEYLDLIEDAEGDFLLQRLEKISSWFLLHGVEHDVLGFRNLKAVVETSLASLRSAKDTFRATRAPLNETSSFMKLLGQVAFGRKTSQFDKSAYTQQVLSCIHEEYLHIYTDVDDSDSDGELDFAKVALDKYESIPQASCEEAISFFRQKQTCRAKSSRLAEVSTGASIQTEQERLRPMFQYRVMKFAVTEFQREIAEIINEICQKEVAADHSKRLNLPFIAVEYLDLVLEPKGRCLLSQIEKITVWLTDHSIRHSLGFGNLKAVVEMNLEAAIKAKNTFRSLRAPKKIENSYKDTIKDTILQYAFGKDSGLFDEEAYKQQVMEVLHSARLQILDQDLQMQQDEISYKTLNISTSNVEVYDVVEEIQNDLPLKRYKAQLLLPSSDDESSLFQPVGRVDSALQIERFSSDEKF